MGPSLSTQSSLKDREPWQPVAAESCLLAQLFLIEPSVDLEELSPAADLSQGQADLRHQVQFFLAQAKSFLELAESSPDLAELSLDLAVSLLAFPDLEESSLDLAMSLLAFPDPETGLGTGKDLAPGLREDVTGPPIERGATEIRFVNIF